MSNYGHVYHYLVESISQFATGNNDKDSNDKSNTGYTATAKPLRKRMNLMERDFRRKKDPKTINEESYSSEKFSKNRTNTNIKAVVCLHNYLRLTDTANHTPAGFIDNEDSTGNIHPGDWRAIVENDGNALHRLKHSQGNRYKFEAKEIRNTFKTHFNSEDGYEFDGN
eukprot:gene5750-11020_t